MIKKFWEYITVKGAIKAKANGIYLNAYKGILKLKILGIEPKTFIDVGANRGMLTKTVNYFFPSCNIYSFEPIMACFYELKKLEKSILTLKTINCALSDYNGSAQFYENNYDYSSSLLKMNKRHVSAFPYSKETSAYKVSVYKLDFFGDIIKTVAPSMLKLDVQGAELKVMRGAGIFLESINYILCEMSFVELYKGQPLVNEIIDYLYEKRFVLIDLLDFRRDPKNNELLQVDGIFKRI